MTSSYRPPLRDIRFVLDEVVGLPQLLETERFGHVDLDTVHGVLDEVGRFMADVVAPTNRDGDRIGSVWNPDFTVTTPESFKLAYKQYVRTGYGAVPFDPEFGGGGFPWVTAIAMQEMLTSANMALSLCPLLTQGAIEAVSHHGSDELRNTYLPRMLTGEWPGTMNLTEPQAGSDVGAVTHQGRAGRATARGASAARRSSSRRASTTSPTTSCTWCWPARPARHPAPRGSRCSSCPSSWSTPTVRSASATTSRACRSSTSWGSTAVPTCVLSFGEATARSAG